MKILVLNQLNVGRRAHLAAILRIVTLFQDMQEVFKKKGQKIIF